VKKFSLALLALATALAISPTALAQQTGDFSFATATAVGGFSGSGTFATDSAGVITGLTGTLYAGATDEGAMTLLAPGGFASNDNLFTDAAPWLSENGLSFSVDENGTVMDYNLYYYATTQSYEATGCAQGNDCITDQAYGVPSEPVNFTATNVTPEPSSLLFLGTGLFGLAVILFRKQKASGHSSIS
jgi:hypothetical protein